MKAMQKDLGVRANAVKKKTKQKERPHSQRKSHRQSFQERDQ